MEFFTRTCLQLQVVQVLVPAVVYGGGPRCKHRQRGGWVEEPPASERLPATPSSDWRGVPKSGSKCMPAGALAARAEARGQSGKLFGPTSSHLEPENDEATASDPGELGVRLPSFAPRCIANNGKLCSAPKRQWTGKSMFIAGRSDVAPDTRTGFLADAGDGAFEGQCSERTRLM
eukprot:s4458_g7.t1